MDLNLEILHNFNVEEQYQFYLKMVGLDEAKMQITQKRETKRAFYAAYGMALLTMRDGIGSIEREEEAIEIMQSLLDQVDNFYKKETN